MTRRSRSHLLVGLALPALVCLAAPPASAQPAAAPMSFDIPAGSLDGALRAFLAQSHLQLIYDARAVRGLSTTAVRGRLSPEEVLARLLEGSGLAYIQRRPGVFVLKPRGPLSPASLAISAAPSLALTASHGPLAQTPAPLAPQVVDQVDEIVVTGSLIRGGGSGASPIVTLSRDDIDRSGRGTVAEMLSDLPQNFGGMASEDSNLVNSDRSGANAGVATGVNLRGMGSSATLVLVNGRRLAGSGLKGDFADVSAIPTAAVERIEVLLDGASALYGSDAVGGVVNIILKTDFNGAETRARLGVAQGGVAKERQIAQTIGKTWSSGHALLSYEHHHRDALPSTARAFTADADLRPLGGTDRRQIYSHPGNILVFDAAGASYVPTWAIPAGQTGQGLTPASFLPGLVNLENQRQQSDVLPRQIRDSLYASAHQALGGGLALSGDARWSRRRYAYALPGSVANLTVTNANPYFVSPNGSASHTIAYDFTDELGPLRSRGVAESLGLSLGLTADLGGSWRGEVYGAYAEDVTKRDNDDRLNTRFLSEALGAIADDPATAFNAARDGYLNPFGAGGVNSAAVLDFVGGGYVRTRYASKISSINAKADGTLFVLPGGDVKLAVGGQFREEGFETRSVSMASRASPTTTLSGPFRRTITAGFAELRVPLVGPANARLGLQRLELSLAGRIERYDDVGTTKNPKIGLLWAPSQALKLRATYGTSFRAPSLPEVYEPQDAGPFFLPSGGATPLVLLRYGGNPDLKPETAKSWTAGLDYAPERLPDLKISLGWFDTRFTHQIGAPVFDDIYNVLGNRAYAPFIHPLNPANPSDLDKVEAIIAQSSSLAGAGLYPANAYTAIVDGRNVNTGGLHIQGLDVHAQYGWRLPRGRLDLGGDATYLLTYARKVTPASPWLSLVDTVGQPVDLRARGTAAWSDGPWSLSLSLNYVDDYAALTGTSIDSWTTADLQAQWRAPASSGFAEGLSLSISMRNLFDTDPPFYDSPQAVGYDAANADPLGRFAAIQLIKRW